MCDLFVCVCVIFIVFPLTILPNHNTSVRPIVLNLVVPREGSKIMIQSP